MLRFFYKRDYAGPTSNSNLDALHFHTAVHVIADKYGVVSLVDLSATKFKKIVLGYSCPVAQSITDLWDVEGNVDMLKSILLVHAFNSIRTRGTKLPDFEQLVDLLLSLDYDTDEILSDTLMIISKEGKVSLPIFARIIERLWTTERKVDDLMSAGADKVKSAALKIILLIMQDLDTPPYAKLNDTIQRIPTLGADLFSSLRGRKWYGCHGCKKARGIEDFDRKSIYECPYCKVRYYGDTWKSYEFHLR